MRAPKFWYPTNNSTERSWQASLLSPLSCLYHYVYERKTDNAKAYKPSIPVICIGNAVAGGGGKTPTALYIYNILSQSDLFSNPVILMRGYKGIEKGPLLVTNTHNVAQVGDEAVLLTQYAPVIVAKNKVDGAQYAEKQGFDCLIMDDGYQNPSLEKTLNILVIDQRGFGNGMLLPAGPLREPAEDALQKADIILTKDNISASMEKIIDDSGKPTFIGRYKTDSKPTPQSRYIAFSGIASPEKFYDTLKKTGLEIIDFYPYPDHYSFKETDIKNLQSKAQATGSDVKLITTEKDWVRLSDTHKKEIDKLKISLDLDDDSEFKHLFIEMLKGDLN